MFISTFGWIFVLTNGGPGISSTTIDFDIYDKSMNVGRFGYGAAESMILLLTAMSILAVTALLIRRLEGNDA